MEKKGGGYIYTCIYIMNRVDGLSFRSNPDLLRRHKTSTNKYISIVQYIYIKCF